MVSNNITKKELYKVINEEISNFDFLGMEDNNNEDVHNSVLLSKEFQTNLVIDLINNSKNKDKFKKLFTTYEHSDVNSFDDTEKIEIELEITYNFNEKNYELIFFIDGESKDDEIKPENFDLTIFSKGGEKIPFDWVEKNQNLYTTLINKFLKPLLEA